MPSQNCLLSRRRAERGPQVARVRFDRDPLAIHAHAVLGQMIGEGLDGKDRLGHYAVLLNMRMFCSVS